MAATAANSIELAREEGQSIWLDFINREILLNGHLQSLIEKGIGGLTSNPSIFQSAIANGSDYDQDLANLAAEGKDANSIYEALALTDIADAADLFRPVFDRTGGRDGFVSIEVDPQIASDTDTTVSEGLRLFETLDRPNVLIKVPATPEGIPAIRRLIGEGVNVNVTLIFSRSAYRNVTNAYIDGLSDYLESGKVIPGEDLSGINSVASFFISRVDSAIDAALPDWSPLMGNAGVANARLAYADYEKIFSGERWARLSTAGAKVQRPLWASTSVKNPDYPELMYVDELIGPNTVNTLPPATLDAFLDHGSVANMITTDVDDARSHWAALATAGVDIEAVTNELLAAGVAAFTDSFVQLMADISKKCEALGLTAR